MPYCCCCQNKKEINFEVFIVTNQNGVTTSTEIIPNYCPLCGRPLILIEDFD